MLLFAVSIFHFWAQGQNISDMSARKNSSIYKCVFKTYLLGAGFFGGAEGGKFRINGSNRGGVIDLVRLYLALSYLGLRS